MNKSFLSFLFHLLVPTFSLPKTDATADFFEGIAACGTGVLSVIVVLFIFLKGVAGMVHWTVMQRWPLWAILSLDLPVTLYIVLQEVRFIRWEIGYWAKVFTALKARWKEEAKIA